MSEHFVIDSYAKVDGKKLAEWVRKKKLLDGASTPTGVTITFSRYQYNGLENLVDEYRGRGCKNAFQKKKFNQKGSSE